MSEECRRCAQRDLSERMRSQLVGSIQTHAGQLASMQDRMRSLKLRVDAAERRLSVDMKMRAEVRELMLADGGELAADVLRILDHYGEYGS